VDRHVETAKRQIVCLGYRFLFLTESRALKMPTPPQMHNHGNYVVSLGDVCRWLAGQAEALGVEI